MKSRMLSMRARREAQDSRVRMPKRQGFIGG